MRTKSLWNVAKEKIMKERGELPNEEKLCLKKTSGAIGKGKMREEKKKEWQKRRRVKKKGVKRGKEKRRKKRTKRRL